MSVVPFDGEVELPSRHTIPKAFLPAHFPLQIRSAAASLNITAERIVPSFSDTRAMFVIYVKTDIKKIFEQKIALGETFADRLQL